MNDFFKILSEIKTPLALAGVSFGIMFLIIKQILSNKGTNNRTAFLIINRLFVLALVAMLLGFFGFIIPPPISTKIKFNIRGIDKSPLERVSVAILNLNTPSYVSNENGFVEIDLGNKVITDSLSFEFKSTEFGISSYKKFLIENIPHDFYFDIKKEIKFFPDFKTNVVNHVERVESINNRSEDNNKEFSIRIRSMLNKIKFNSSIDDVFAYEFGKNLSSGIEYVKLPIASECSDDSIRYYWIYLSQSKFGTYIYSVLNSQGLNQLVTNDSYILYSFKNNKLIRITLRIISNNFEIFEKNFTAFLIKNTDLPQKKYNMTKYNSTYYITGSSFTDQDYYEILMCNENGYNSCDYDWWH